MKERRMSGAQRWLLALSLVLILIAEALRHTPMPERTTIIVGAAEVLMAMIVGASFAIAASSRD